jgi:hypothetical protein
MEPVTTDIDFQDYLTIIKVFFIEEEEYMKSVVIND